MVKAGERPGRDRRSALALALVVAIVSVLSTAGAASAAGGPRILATGDSMMRYVDGSLAARLAEVGEVSFRSDVRIGSAVTKAPWVQISRRQVRTHRPRATIVFMGANDGFPVGGFRCCGRKWLAEYQDHVQQMIRAYSRHGRGEVYWVTLPGAEFGRRVNLFPLLNAAMRRAVRIQGPNAHIVDLWKVFTPHGQYRRTMLWNGTETVIRAQDGVHLSGHGAAIAGELIRNALVADGIVQ